MIVSITGSPGTGKTSVSKKVSKALVYRLVELNKLAEDKKLYLGYDRKRGAKIVDIKKIQKEVAKLNNTVIESHYSHLIKSDLVFVLRRDPKELIKIYKKRGWSKKKVDENIGAEIMEICKNEAIKANKNVYEIENIKIGKTADMIIEIVRKCKN